MQKMVHLAKAYKSNYYTNERNRLNHINENAHPMPTLKYTLHDYVTVKQIRQAKSVKSQQQLVVQNRFKRLNHVEDILAMAGQALAQYHYIKKNNTLRWQRQRWRGSPGMQRAEWVGDGGGTGLTIEQPRFKRHISHQGSKCISNNLFFRKIYTKGASVEIRRLPLIERCILREGMVRNIRGSKMCRTYQTAKDYCNNAIKSIFGTTLSAKVKSTTKQHTLHLVKNNLLTLFERELCK